MSLERDADREPGRPRLVLATANQHKLVELTRILEAGRVEGELAGLSGFPGAPDDSGLCVDALNGMPGVLSARWSGRHGDDEANLRLVLDQLSDVPDERRGAQFVCSAARALPSGKEHVSEGTVYGRLIREPRGTNGFGYDPIFAPRS